MTGKHYQGHASYNYMASTWREFKKKKKYPKLQRDIKVEIAIVGGGMAGVLAAYKLNKAGLSVALVEKRELGTYATMDTTAFITEVIDTDLSKVASIFSERTAKLVWQSGEVAIAEFEKIIREEEIDCEFIRCPNYIFANSRKQFKELQEEYEWYKKLKIKATLHQDGKNLNFPNFGYIEVPDQAKFHPAKFLYSLAEKAVANGVKIFENTEATEIAENGPVVIETRDGTLTTRDVIIATYKPLTNEKTHLKKAMYRSYICEVKLKDKIFKEATYEDNSNPYYYFRVDSFPEYDRVIVGGEDHKDIFGKSLVDKSFTGLKDFIDQITSGHPYKIVTKWNGPILEPSDGLALIGEIKPHHYVATGFSGNGMTYSMISSMIFADTLTGKRNLWAAIYNPKRTILEPKRLASKAKDYIEEFIGGAIKNLLK